MSFKKWLVAGLILVVFFQGTSQSITTPYSSFGIGELLPVSYAHNEAMGGVGIGMPLIYATNNRNAAWLSYNTFAMFQVGVRGEVRTLESNSSTVTDQTGSLGYLSLSFPLIQGRWGTHLSLEPFSNVNYFLTATTPIENTTNLALTEFNGSGGITQLAWSNGFRLFEGVNIGIRGEYYFGKIDEAIENIVVSEDTTFSSVDFRTGYTKSATYNDYNVELSFAHRIKLKEENFFNYGLTYHFAGQLQGAEDISIQRYDGLGALLQNELIEEDVSLAADVPQQIGFGVSYEKANFITVALDVEYELWEGVEGLQVNTRNTFNSGIGVNYVPDIKSVNSYFSRVNYRFGMAYKQVPYLIGLEENTEINDFGINFGGSFPVGGLSNLDAAFKFGWRGTTDNNLVRERYFQITFGATINDRWFVKRRYE